MSDKADTKPCCFKHPCPDHMPVGQWKKAINTLAKARLNNRANISIVEILSSMVETAEIAHRVIDRQFVADYMNTMVEMEEAERRKK